MLLYYIQFQILQYIPSILDIHFDITLSYEGVK